MHARHVILQKCLQTRTRSFSPMSSQSQRLSHKGELITELQSCDFIYIRPRCSISSTEQNTFPINTRLETGNNGTNWSSLKGNWTTRDHFIFHTLTNMRNFFFPRTNGSRKKKKSLCLKCEVDFKRECRGAFSSGMEYNDLSEIC